ncbi:MAG: NAD-glutamate dehydrogenase, partial [Halieaceae bacterium]|nr:NAD-glutamate dehydrogenase [Halieaceae bacterium]
IWLQSYLNTWVDGSIAVKTFTPDRDHHGWNCDSSVVWVVCPQMPFCTASIRGALHRLNISIDWLTSCNVNLSAPDNARSPERYVGDIAGIPISVLYFEVEQQESAVLEEVVLPELLGVMREVDAVVSNFALMQTKLVSARQQILAEPIPNQEIADLLTWFVEGKATLLGYQHFDEMGERRASVAEALGLLQYPSHSAASCETKPEYLGQPVGESAIRFSKSSVRSKVHRCAYPDLVDIALTDANGVCRGVHRFMILLTFAAYNQDPRDIPWLRGRIGALLEQTGFDEQEHEGRELLRVIELYPRDELFQSDLETLLENVLAINRIQERRQTRLFIRRDAQAGFANCLVYVPRELYNTQLRERIQASLMLALGAIEAEFSTQFSESVLVRVHFVFRCDLMQLERHTATDLESEVQDITQGWMERVQSRLRDLCGRKQAQALVIRFAQYFSLGYQSDFAADIAADDVLALNRLSEDRPLKLVLHALCAREGEFSLRLYHRGESLPLSDVLPVLESMGLRVLSERPYKILTEGSGGFWIQEFTLQYRFLAEIAIDDIKADVEDAFLAMWQGVAEVDAFNQLLLGAGASWRDVAILRAYARYSKQILFTYTPDFMAAALGEHMDLAALLIQSFYAKFKPDQASEWAVVSESYAAAFEQGLEQVANLGEDRVLRQYWQLLEATVRTNFFLCEDSAPSAHFAFKFKPASIADMIKPVPYREIYVYSPRVEGVHLRGGPVARGGLRWSDRSEDFRTEVLGLVKAQQVKNAVIVPVGAKGGFVARQLHPGMTREQRNEEGVACYQLFVSALLELTDNQIEGAIVRARNLVVHDGDDPYLVVAADKGTATFSDIANQIASDFNFWLGDAFASGGSIGYDHKKMGITARGAWISVQRHFHELGLDVQRDPVVTIGIGDMSGDVFGNGMLLSKSLRLVAAFNHKHIFIDPNPDAAASFAERQRLFCESTNGWDDYDQTLISEGGGIFERSAKRITLSKPMQTLVQTHANTLTPTELIHLLLKAKVDLLWNGGIGTYVKASSESHIEVGDKAGDALRVNGAELGAKVVGEGGNLGMTQRGRIEYGLAGGRCNTDFIDNAGGVDCSDHEVNIKIFLNALLEQGLLDSAARVAKLESYTEAVARHVLHNNRSQTLALSLLAQDSQQRVLEYQQLIEELDAIDILDRELEFLPSNVEIGERRAQGQGLTRPELAVLLSASKSHLKRLLHSDALAQEDAFLTWVERSFPSALIGEFGPYLRQHRLYPAILATQLANDMVNRLGPNVYFRQRHATGASPEEFARCYVVAMSVFDLEHFWSLLAKEGQSAAPEQVYQGLMQLSQLLKRTLRWFLRHPVASEALLESVATFKSGIAALLTGDCLSTVETHGGQWRHGQLEWQSKFEDPGLCNLLSQSDHAHMFPGLVQSAAVLHCSLEDLAQLFFALERRLGLDVLTRALLSTQVDSEWRVLARDAYLEQIVDIQLALCRAIISCESRAQCAIDKTLIQWSAERQIALTRWGDVVAQLKAVQSPDFAVYAVVLRELSELARAA